MSSVTSESSTMWRRLSPSCQTAFAWAAAYDPDQRSPRVFSENLLLGLIRVHRPTSEPEILLLRYNHSLTELEQQVVLVSTHHRIDPGEPLALRDLPALSRNSQRALNEAVRLSEVGGGKGAQVQAPHLFGGLLTQPKCYAFVALAGVLGGSIDLDQIARQYVEDFLPQGPSADYTAFLNRVQSAPPDPDLASSAYPADIPLSDLFGREVELQQIERALAKPARPVAFLNGQRGAGKTALALAAARRVARKYPDGQVTVNWRNDASRKPSVIAELEAKLGVRLTPPETLASALSGRQVLLIYDDVPPDAILEDLLPPSTSAAIVIGVSPPVRQGDAVIDVVGLDATSALELLGSVIGPEQVSAQPEMASTLVQLLDFTPAKIEMIGAVLKGADIAIDALSDWLKEPAQRGLGAVELRARATDVFGALEPFRRERAGYASDAETKTDDLEFRSDVVPLCEVIMAQDVTPPLSIGLFGEWGSGKSSFMQLMRSEIKRIARESANASDDGRDSAFCTEVCQITFNAWHYADANLWASLVINIFEQLRSTGRDGVDRTAEAERQRQSLLVKLDTQKELLREAQMRKEAAGKNLDFVKAALRTAEETDPVRKLADDPDVKRAAETIKTELGIEDASPETIERVAHELEGLPGQIRKGLLVLQNGRDVKAVALPIGLAVLVGLLTYAISQTSLTAWLVALALGSVGSIAGFIAGPLAVARGIAGIVAQAAGNVQAARAKARERTAELQHRVEEAERSVEEVQREITEIEAGHRLRKFIEDRSRSSDYLSHLGIISLIRRDFEELSILLEENRLARREHKNEPHEGLPPIDRVILYIDDLDRCSAAKVVEVLEAVHLLLAFDIFVAVVGVDPRWLVKSLERYYSTQLTGEKAQRLSPAGDDWTATPQNYLEKIFQIPFVLKPMGKDGFEALVGHLLPVRTEQGTGEAAANSVDGGKAIGKAPPAEPAVQPEAQDDQTPRPTTKPDQPLVLDPENLNVYEHELRFAQRLSTLITTPRSAKRLINTYRLIRASLPELEYRALVRKDPPGDYPTVLMLLAAMIGFPALAEDLFRDLLAASPTVDFWVHLAELGDADQPRTSDGDQSGKSDRRRWAQLSTALAPLRPPDGAPLPVERVCTWIPRVARYSFQTSRFTIASSA